MSLNNHDALYGTTATAAGALGITVQVVTEFASLTAAILNVVLALGGLYLLYRRIKRSHGHSNRF